MAGSWSSLTMGHQFIVRPLLRKILRDLGLTPETYSQILEEL
jgi:hypothetical protein